MAKRIYAADDEENIRDVIKSFLDDAGYETTVFSTGDALYEQFLKEPCDLAILDIMMPGTDGLGILKKLRSISTVPVIILTAKDGELDYCMGMSYGGDDYLMKPFRPSMLVMRIKALFRRIEIEHADQKGAAAEDISGAERDQTQDEEVSFGDLFYSSARHAITCGNSDLNLTMTEFSLLRYMLVNHEKAISRDELLNKVWGIDSDVETRVTDETVRRVRRKLKALNSRVSISVIWGYGYKLEVMS